MSSKYNMSATKEFKSHSSWLYNERMAVLFYLLDMDSVSLNMEPTNINLLKKVYSYNAQIYKNVRMVIRSDPTMRYQLRLNTKDSGIYITDLHLSTIERMIRICESESGWTPKRCYIITAELNNFEISVKDVLQYYSYFIRSSVKQKPDVLMATQKYKEMADGKTIEQLKEIVGKNHKIDFDNISLITDKDVNNEEDDEDDDDDDFEEDTDTDPEDDEEEEDIDNEDDD